MTPLHPKLRRALLQDPLHRDRGLTPKKLIEYEGLLTQLYYLVYYSRGFETTDKDLLVRQIFAFRDSKSPTSFMPNYDRIYRAWIDGQKKALTRHYHGPSFNGVWELIQNWIAKVFRTLLRKDRKDAKLR